MYTFNVLFNFDHGDGLFSGDEPALPGLPPIPVPLRASRNWLELIGNPANPFDPEAANWRDLGQASTLLLHSNPDPGDICIRLAPDRRGAQPANNATLQLVVAFGRPVPFTQPQASPFTDNGLQGGNVITTFVFGPVQRNTGRGWFFTLGQIARRPGNQRLTHRYQFSLGVIVTDGNTVRHYGEDPEMDVGD